MALNEACQLWIEQEGRAAVERGETPAEAGRRIAEEILKYFETNIPPRTIEQKVRRMAEKPATNVATPNHLRKRTKPEAKSALKAAVKVIESGEAADDDTKEVGDALAKAIKNGKSAPRVGTAVATAVKETFKKGAPQPKQEPDNFQRLWKHVLAATEGLTFFADKTIKPTTPDELNAAKGILEAGPSIITQYARLGIDVVGIYETFVGRGEKLNGREIKQISP